MTRTQRLHERIQKAHRKIERYYSATVANEFPVGAVVRYPFKRKDTTTGVVLSHTWNDELLVQNLTSGVEKRLPAHEVIGVVAKSTPYRSPGTLRPWERIYTGAQLRALKCDPTDLAALRKLRIVENTAPDDTSIATPVSVFVYCKRLPDGAKFRYASYLSMEASRQRTPVGGLPTNEQPK